MACLESRQDPLLLYLEVPYVCLYDDYCSSTDSFLDIPERHGLYWYTAHNTEFSGLDEGEAPSFLQGWLFFAMLNKVSCVVGVKFQPSDFVSSSPKTQPVICGKELKTYTWLWTAAFFRKTIDERRDCLTHIKAHLDILNRVVNAWIEQEHTPISSIFDRILLSLVILGETLMFTLSQIAGGSMANDILKPGYLWTYPRYGRERLLQAGWCIGELPALLLKCPPTILLYLSSIHRDRLDKDHSQCSSVNGCLVNQLDLKTYKTAHALDCQDNQCRIIQAPVQDICNVLNAGGIPLVNIVMTDDSINPTLQVQAFMLDNEQQVPKYVAISHVWSDGMGNPGQNALMACQLRRIQQSVNRLYPAGSSTTKNWLFWMDTLCVPLQSEMRVLAITRMAKTFLHSEKVLVLDNWLSRNRSDMAPRDLLVKITHSDWNKRLWTFQEAILAKECHFHFDDKALTIDDLKDSVKVTENLQEVSDILSRVEKTELLRNENMLNLLRALTSVDLSALERCQKYAALPLQSSPDKEELRLHAVQNIEALARQNQLFEQWFPVLAQADCISTNPDFDEEFRAHIETRIFDPVYSYGLESLWRLRGFLFDLVVSRVDDIAGGAKRQLKAFKDISPAFMLTDVSRGLPGRTTSRLEDETICLGGIIGLDVTPLLRVRIDERKREEEVEKVCVERMKIFLSMVKTFPSSILFWEAKRIRDNSWGWAPLSFLDKRACAAMFNTEKAECTPNGLLGLYNGIRLTLNKFSAIEKRFRTLRLQYTDPETAEAGIDKFPYRRSWESVEIRTSNANPKPEYSWYDCFSDDHKEVALVIFGQQGLEGVLVSILRTDQEVIYARYLSNVSRVSGDDEPEYLESYVNGEWMSKRKWCVG